MSQIFCQVLWIQRETNPGPCKLRLRRIVLYCLEVNVLLPAPHYSCFIPKLISKVRHWISSPWCGQIIWGRGIQTSYTKYGFSYIHVANENSYMIVSASWSIKCSFVCGLTAGILRFYMILRFILILIDLWFGLIGQYTMLLIIDKKQDFTSS